MYDLLKCNDKLYITIHQYNIYSMSNMLDIISYDEYLKFHKIHIILTYYNMDDIQESIISTIIPRIRNNCRLFIHINNDRLKYIEKYNTLCESNNITIITHKGKYNFSFKYNNNLYLYSLYNDDVILYVISNNSMVNKMIILRVLKYFANGDLFNNTFKAFETSYCRFGYIMLKLLESDIVNEILIRSNDKTVIQLIHNNPHLLMKVCSLSERDYEYILKSKKENIIKESDLDWMI